MKIGVLAVQGDFAAHERVLERLGAPWCEVRHPEQLREISGLILPGGESTTMLKFLLEEGFWEPLQELARRGGAFFGTCAGAILLAREVTNPRQPSLGFLDISVQRNAYGRQINSFVDRALSPAFGPPPLEMVYIRAPIITRVGPNVEVLAEHGGHPVLVQQGRCLAATFHPELTDDLRIHRRFLQLVEAASAR
ncbi:MAG: pyridoxal 5'-phosphate synthase glutaminase subunit PdxT [Blastocatellia bacterium]|nr:pyridoxal 5'-phosphate synthase glutaminase subunit PdxT [Blastocatellia bacterium]MCS7158362.1 pyridoxal 5'-phosphate synthase glutaminase subunit PdxT [Blastocatellia bacterium]MCX7752868.1 pyridoxal 5'-phosphate synthase glutaminase subunit PdxT [Blastocatellia bacterium]MDW8167924.1 pyridoxal 5'-phosphate synthase glutaminase subunit PdxT [Acidobacteriota bacterium]MDW8255949.1 pyridoxal 5'-phosphate synthase glutaminase subunit PdxT [Acidobacteriota bacterium]